MRRSPPRGIRQLVPPPFTRARVARALLVLAVLVLLPTWVITGIRAHDDLQDAAAAYYESLAQENGPSAYALLCADAQARTTPAELATVARQAGGVGFVGRPTKSSGNGFWPWRDDGRATLTIRLGRTDLTVSMAMRDENGWRACPPPSRDHLGRRRPG